MADVPPFGANVAGVTALVPEATLRDTIPPGQRGITTAQVDGWLAALSARVDRRLDGWEKLAAEPTELEAGVEQPADRDQLITAARDLVHQGAASYLEAARHPEQAGKATTTYSAVLWDRFTEGLAELAEWLVDRLEHGTPGGDDDDAVSAPSVAFDFPPASFTADLAT